MGQKINPISLRLQTTNRHFDNCWYSNYFYKNLITKDLLIQSYLNSFLKQVKLPAGRYSIQHLQKKTQISSFFCFSKPTREWRSQIFGLSKNKKSNKRSRYFFKISPKFKRKVKKQTQLSQFYHSLNQTGVYKIQKKITSFQNFHLWSSFFQIQKNSIFNWGLLNNLKKTTQNLKNHNNFLQDFNFVSQTQSTLETLLRNQKNLSLLQKNQKLANLSVIENSVTNSQKQKTQNYPLISLKNDTPSISLKSLAPFLENSISSCNLLFLQNLLIYKILKSKKRSETSIQHWNLDASKNFLVSSRKPKFKTLDLKYASYLESHLSVILKQQIDLIAFKVKNDWQNASYLAEEIVYFLEKRLPFRRLKSKLVKQFSKIEKIRGVRITCSGRVGGKSKKAQRSKVECLKYGQTSLHVFSSKIDFAQKTAFTSFGSVGIKVWICYK